MAEVQLADVLALVRNLREANQAALIQRVEQLEHASGIQKYAISTVARLAQPCGSCEFTDPGRRCPRCLRPAPLREVHKAAVQRRIGDYCPDVPESPATLDPVEHARFNEELAKARREDF